MDMIYGSSFQPIQAKAFTDAHTRAFAADRTARQAARRRMEVTGAVPVRPISRHTPQDSFARRPFGQAAARRGPAARRAPPEPAASLQAVRTAWPLSFAGVLALYRDA